MCGFYGVGGVIEKAVTHELMAPRSHRRRSAGQASLSSTLRSYFAATSSMWLSP